MELGESVGVGEADVESADAPSCEHQDKKETYGWKARVNGWGADGKKCSGENLYSEAPNGMWPRRVEHERDMSLGVVPEKKPNAHWAGVGLDGVTERDFPLQAHHLIPKNFLPNHEVVVYLCKKWSKDARYQLSEDTEYNTDHANNGYAMPDALRLKEWKGAANDADRCGVAFQVMARTKVQLHQGSHAAELDPKKIQELLRSGQMPQVTPAGAGGDSDDFEDAQIHDDGYLNQIDEWLNAVAGRIENHVLFCTAGCKKGQQSDDKESLRPLQDAVRLMDRVSYIAKVFLQMNLLYACPYGQVYAAAAGLLQWDEQKGDYIVYRETPAGPEELTVAQVKQALAVRPG